MINFPDSVITSPLKDDFESIIETALDAVNPRKAVQRFTSWSDNHLVVGNVEYALELFDNVCVLGVGKASQSMAAGLYESLGGHINTGVVVVKQNEIDTSVDLGPIKVIEGSHPVPDSRSLDAAKRIMKLATNLEPSDLAIVLISGGASSLVALPVAGVTLGELQRTTDLLLRSGANIEELNVIRRHLSGIKGGNLAEAIAPAKIITLILSDVIGDDISAIGSGPTAPDSSTFQDTLSVLEKYELMDELPQSVSSHLNKGAAGEIEDTPGSSNSVFEKVQNEIIGSNKHAATAAFEAAQEIGFGANLLTTELNGEARDAGKYAAKLAIELKDKRTTTDQPQCLVLGGETTVTIKGFGKGGRNQELALAAAIDLDGIDDVLVVALATDGTDGPTDSAGAVVTGATCQQARDKKLDPKEYLDNNDSYTFFNALGDHIITGPTRTNVADLLLIFAF